jgi:hypothetical protein
LTHTGFYTNRQPTFDLAGMRRMPAAALHKLPTSVDVCALIKISLGVILRAPIPIEYYTGEGK